MPLFTRIDPTSNPTMSDEDGSVECDGASPAAGSASGVLVSSPDSSSSGSSPAVLTHLPPVTEPMLEQIYLPQLESCPSREQCTEIMQLSLIHAGLTSSAPIDDGVVLGLVGVPSLVES